MALALTQARGLGQAADETPEIKTLPWKIGAVPEVTRADRAAARWDKVSMLIGVIGGTLGIYLSYKAIKGE